MARTRRRLIALAVVAAATLAIGAVATPSASAADWSVSWTGTQTYAAGQFQIDGPDGSWLVFQDDGNLVSYISGCGGWCSLVQWNSNTYGSWNYLALQDDGNIVVYNWWGLPLWSANWGEFSGQGPYTLAIGKCYGYVPRETNGWGQPIYMPC